MECDLLASGVLTVFNYCHYPDVKLYLHISDSVVSPFVPPKIHKEFSCKINDVDPLASGDLDLCLLPSNTISHLLFEQLNL